MLGVKQVILTIAGVGTLSGASVGCYYCFKSKAPESSQSASNNLSSATEQSTEAEGTPNRDTETTSRSSSGNTDRSGDGTQTTLPSQPVAEGRSSTSGLLPAGSLGASQPGHTG